MQLLANHYEESRPWGGFERFTDNESTTVKLIRVLPGKRLSLQTHAHRAEYWRVLEGSGLAEVEGVTHELSPGVSVDVPLGAAHRMSAGVNGLVVLEIATGHFDENDIVRVEDDFGRSMGNEGAEPKRHEPQRST